LLSLTQDAVKTDDEGTKDDDDNTNPMESKEFALQKQNRQDSCENNYSTS
jgi:hypothetical protein